MNPRPAARALLLALLITTSGVGASTLDQTFMNDFESNAMYFWSVDPSNMSLDGFAAGANMGGWKAELSTPAQMILRGPTVAAAAGRFNLLMNYKNTPFRLEWAEVFFDNVSHVVRGYGTLTFTGSGWSNANVATHVIDIPLHPTVAATPVPPSLVFMLSALSLITCKVLRKRATV